MSTNIYVTLIRITAVLRVDDRNPFDKLILKAVGISSIPADLKQSMNLSREGILTRFRRITATGLLSILISADSPEEIHKLQSLIKNGQRIQEIELLAREKILQQNGLRPVRSSFDLGVEIVNLIVNLRDAQYFAGLQLSEAKFLSMIPLINPNNNQSIYQLNFDASTKPRVREEKQ